MEAEERDPIERFRDTYVRRTRRWAISFYVGATVLTIVNGGVALVDDARLGALGIAAGAAVGVGAFLFDKWVHVSPRQKRWSMVIGMGVGLAAFLAFIAVSGDRYDAASRGMQAGLFAAAIPGIAAVRRRTSTDDAFVLEKIKRGWDLDNPYAWLRPNRSGSRGSNA